MNTGNKNNPLSIGLIGFFSRYITTNPINGSTKIVGTTYFSIWIKKSTVSISPAANRTTFNTTNTSVNTSIGAVPNKYNKPSKFITVLCSATADANAKADAAIAAIKDGSLKVFNTKTFTVGGKSLEDLIKAGGDYAKYAAYVKDGAFNEQNGFAAPAFDLRIDGIVER